MKVIDQLQTAKVGYQYAEHKLTKYFSLDVAAPLPYDVLPNEFPIYETTATLKMRQVGTSKNVESFEKKLIHEQAAMSIARELYGDVVERLYKVREVLYEDGPRYDDKVMNLVVKLIDDLLLRNKFR